MNRKGFLGIMMLALVLAMVIPETDFGQGRGRGRNRANWEGNGWSHNNKKCAKFRNCHDARDGRWDGRGARGDRVGYRFWRNRSRNRTAYTNRLVRVRRARSYNRY